MLCVDLPATDYLQALKIQRTLVERQIALQGPDVLILLEHPATITLGTRGSPAHLLAPQEELRRHRVAVLETDRGGEGTYHGPGQLVAYPILNLKRKGLSVRDYVEALEQTILCTLAAFRVAGFRRKGKPGVWMGEQEKIASIGVRIRQRVTYHGFSLNVSMPVDPSRWVLTCGMPHVRMVSLAAYVDGPVSMEQVRRVVSEKFSEVFGTQMTRASLHEALNRGPDPMP